MKTQAETILNAYFKTGCYDTLIALSERDSVEQDQDWEEERSTFTFSDGSRLEFCNNEVAAL
jgi:outer membrane protease